MSGSFTLHAPPSRPLVPVQQLTAYYAILYGPDLESLSDGMTWAVLYRLYPTWPANLPEQYVNFAMMR